MRTVATEASISKQPSWLVRTSRRSTERLSLSSAHGRERALHQRKA